MNNLSLTARNLLLLSMMGLCMLLSQPVLANHAQQEMKTIYGWHLMTRTERHHFRYLYSLQQTAQDRENFLTLHKLKMQIRARQLGHRLAKPQQAALNSRRASLSGRVKR